MKERSLLLPFLAIFFVVQAILGLQGFCMADEGWSLTGYQQIFHEPSSIQYMFLFYNKLWIGGIWESLFGWMGIYGFRILNILFMLASWSILFLLLRNYIHQLTICLGAIFVMLAHNYGVMVFDHSSVTVLTSAAIAFFLFKGLRDSSRVHLYIAGILLAVNSFSRIPNIAQVALLLLFIPYFVYTRNKLKTFQLLGTTLLGILTGITLELGLMAVLGHLQLFLDNLTTGLSAATSSDSSHNLSSMLTTNLSLYVQIVKDILKLAFLPTVAILSLRFIKSRKATHALIIILAILQAGILLVFFDNILFVYAFDSIVLFSALYYSRRNQPLLYLIGIALIQLYVMPLGSDFGINNMGENAIWLATPLSTGLAAEGLRNLTNQRRNIGVTAFASFIFAFLIQNGWHIMHNAYFDEGPRFEKHYRIHNPLATTFTSEKYAHATDAILTELRKYVHEGDYLFCFQSRPMLHYLTHTRPFMYNPWPWSFDTTSMKLHLERAEARGGQLPVLVREKNQMIDFTLPDELWNSTTAQDDFAHKNAKVKLIHDFIQRNDYNVIWESSDYQILITRQTQ